MTEDPSSTLTGCGFILAGVCVLDLCNSVDPSAPTLGLNGLLLADDDLPFSLNDILPFLDSLNLLLILSPTLSGFFLFSSTTAAWSTAVNGGLGGPFIAAA